MDLRELLRNPTVEGLLKLTSTEFEAFVHQVFATAGYVVHDMGRRHVPHGSGFDLHLHHEALTSLPVARVECRRYDPARSITLHDFEEFLGTLIIAGGHVPGILVTTTTFHENAIHAAARVIEHDVLLIDGTHLCRYIRYLTGSRALDDERILATPIAPRWLFEADGITYRTMPKTAILAACSNKGGVGKTTSAITMGLALANPHNQQRVLLVDLDGQGNLTQDLPPPVLKHNESPVPRVGTMADYILKKCSLQEIVAPTTFANVWVIPSNLDLLKLDQGGGAHPGEEITFIRDIQSVIAPDGMPFDWIILDTPTTQSTLTRSACGAAHIIFIPAQIEPFAWNGTNNALNTVKTMVALLGRTDSQIMGCITQSSGKDDKLIETRIVEDIEISGGSMLRQPDGALRRIPIDKKVDKSHIVAGQGKITPWFGPTNKAAQEYLSITKELVKYAKNA